MSRFADRVDAGRRLARRLAERVAEAPDAFADPVVLGLPRGGVPVAAEVARELAAPLDVLIVRKVGAPGQEEVAMGAVGESDAVVRNDHVIRVVGISAQALAAAEDRKRAEVAQRAELFRRGRSAVSLEGRTAIIVDDGIATGATVRAACAIAAARGAARVVVAVPVAAPDVLDDLAEADEVICLLTPAGFMAVGMHYVDFRQTEDAEVVRLLAAASA